MAEELVFAPMEYVEKAWGYEKIIENNELYCGKLLFFKKDGYSSFHYHVNKLESFYLAKGKMLIKYSYGDYIDEAETTLLLEGMKMNIPRQLRHRLIALEESHLYEFSTFSEDSDSYRLTSSCPTI